MGTGREVRAGAVLALVVLLSAMVAGCTLLPAPDGKERPKTQTVTDDYGRNVEVPVEPEKVISIAPSNTEILYAIGAADRLVAVDNNSNYPAAAASKPHISGFMWTDWEAIVAFEPDVVFAEDINKNEREAYESRNLTIFFFAPKSLSDISDSIRTMGMIMGLEKAADGIADDFDARVDVVRTKVASVGSERKDVYLELDGSWGYWTYGPGTFGHELITVSNGDNIAGGQADEYPSVTAEFIIGADPDVIIYQTGLWVTTTKEDIEAREGWGEVTACKEDRIYGIDGDLVSRPGPRMADGLETVAAYIYPGLFS